MYKFYILKPFRLWQAGLFQYKNIGMKTDIYRTLGAAVRGYRHELGWSQEELGGRSGLHPSYIGQIPVDQQKHTYRIIKAALCPYARKRR